MRSRFARFVVLKLCCLLVLVVSATGSAQRERTAPAGPVGPSDPAASASARQLYRRLRELQRRGTLFGHQDDLTAGVGWRNEPNRSDVFSTTGAYPAVYGWDLGNVELGKSYNFDGVPFALIKAAVVRTAAAGGINTISWHLNNPVTGGTAWDTTGHPVAQLLPGGARHEYYKQCLDAAAHFLHELQDAQRQDIPIVFRPFHEHTGHWFWWGQTRCSAAEFKQLWRFTADYLRRDKRLHSLLLAYSAADFTSKEHYLERYPGDAYVDVLGFDTYCTGRPEQYRQQLDRQLTMVQALGNTHHKFVALTETGYNQLPVATWWTHMLLPILLKHRPLYVLLWRNGALDRYNVPFPGQISAPDFISFKNHPRVLFSDKTGLKSGK